MLKSRKCLTTNFLSNFQDCHGSLTANPAPVQDDTQNYMIDSGYQNATHTQVSAPPES